MLNMSHVDVERWDDLEIFTKPREHDCITETLRLSRSQRTVTRITRSTTSEPWRRSDGQDVTFRLENGVKVWTDLKNARKEGFRRIMRTGDFIFEE
jgi:hypothetical protein